MKPHIQNSLLAILFCIFLFAGLQCKKSGKVQPKPDPPVLSTIDPVEGIVGAPVSIKGTNLEDVDKVTFNDVVATTIVQNTSTSITTVVPTGAVPGINKIKVHNSGGTSNEIEFEVFETPEQTDSLPPTLTQVIPSANYTDYPVLIYGDNLSGTVKLTFNGKNATIYTNIQKVITANVPTGLPAGPATIEVTTLKGKKTINFQVQGPPVGGAAPLNFAIITLPPINYVPSISNQWSCGLFSRTGGDEHAGGNFVELNSDTTGNQDFSITGTFEYHFDATKNYNDLNFIEIINHSTNDTLAGQFSSKFSNPCVLKMVLISSKTGTIDTCIYDRRNDQPDLTCEE
ncbi:hypothetical protein FC093_22495 [Ilyomonas limi]|uniref:IPT/TIG domain-containing protein n=1 Tax=Ilyomonas limi TaxID=2575867 RepID=A0A4U3KQH1_9BACT|nr:hypothetical protein [Ilyomonas limi]TKK64480.1 hypothetical protein FC093_22495 [Ilyomonas limi]